MARARAAGAAILSLPVESGQSAAVAHGANFLAAMGESSFMAMPGDVPLATAADIDSVIATHPRGQGVTLVPARDHYGTNAIIVTPPSGMRFQFGPDSYYRHLYEARAAVLPVRVIELPSLGLDIDTPSDLALLMRHGPSARVAHKLAAFGLTERLEAVAARPAVRAVAV